MAAPVNRTVDVLAAYAWRLIVIGAVGLSVLWLVTKLWIVFLAGAIAIMLTRALATPAAWLRNHLPNALAAAATMLVFLFALAGVLVGIGFAVAGEADEIRQTLSIAIDDLEDWLVDDSPFDISRADTQRFRDDLGSRVGDILRDSSGTIVSGAVIAVEVVLTLVLGLIVTFFMLKDGDRFLRFIRRVLPEDRVDHTVRLGERAWRTLGGYLRGAAILGLFEGTVIGLTLWIVGADLVLPVAVLTFIAAFVPFVGAIVAGAIAVLVTLATVGLSAAIVVLVVAFLVQQFDNDLLAPVIYGKALELHPVVILVSITAGGMLFGLAGSFLAVPITAVILNVLAEAHGISNGTDVEAAASD